MFVINVLLLAVLVWANLASEKGVLYFMSSEYPPKSIFVGVEGINLVGNDKIELVHLCNSGAIWYPNHRKYLTVNANGLLVLGDMPNLEMTVAEIRGGSRWSKGFYFRGNDKFQLCSDGTICFQSDCVSGRQIHIMYEKDWANSAIMRNGY